MVAEDIRLIIPRNSYTEVLKDTWYMVLVRSVTNPKSVSSVSGESSGELSEGKLTG